MDRNEIVFETIEEVVKLMKDPCSFRMFLERLGLDSKDYEALYKAGGMYLTNLACELE